MKTTEETGDCGIEGGGDDGNGFSNEECYPCTLCGQDLRTRVKVEATDDSQAPHQEELFPVSLSSSKRSGGEDPLSRKESTSGSDDLLQPSRWTEEEKLIYRWFLKWFRVNLYGYKAKGKRTLNLGWDADCGKDLFPFCFQCRYELLAILDLQLEIEELERKIQDEVEKVKRKATSCEDLFDRLKVYGKDARYKRLRKQIVPDFSARYPIERPQVKTKPRTEIKKKTLKTRKSGKEEAVIIDAEAGNINSYCSNSNKALPIVLLTTSDKVTAEQHLIATGIKSESPPDDLDDFIEKARHEKSDDDDSDQRGTIISQMPESDNLNSSTIRRSGRKRKSNVRLKTTNKIIAPPEACNDDPLLNTELEDDWAEDNYDDGDDDYQPAPSPAQRTPSKKKPNKQSRPSTKNRKWEIVDPEDDEDYSDPPTPPPFGACPKNRKKPLDEDFTANDDEVQVDSEDDLDDIDSDNFEDDIKWTRIKAVVDVEQRTLTYNGLLFNQKEPFAENKYECSECGAVIRNRKCNVRSHYIRKHTNTYLCRRCGFRAQNKSLLKKHIASVHKGLSVPTRPKYRSRLTTQCSICARPLQGSRVKDHEWSHKSAEEKRQAMESEDSCVPSTMIKQHQCEECGHKFAQRSNLRRHKEINHPSSEEVKPRTMELCAECGGTFYCLKSHRRNVHGVGLDPKKMYTCLESGCGKQFKNLRCLSRHKDAVHRKITPFQCSLCPRAFSLKRNLKKHLDVHNGLRPWKCEHCTSSFAHKSNLQRHVGIYHTEGSNPRRKAYTRGPAMLPSDVRKRDLVNEGKYLPPSALATWAAGREPTSHFPVGMNNIISSLSATTATSQMQHDSKEWNFDK